LEAKKMAIASAGWNLNVRLVDTGGNQTNRSYDLISADADEAATHSAAIIAALEAVTDAAVAGYTIGEVFLEGALTYPAAAEVENCAEISAKIVGFPNKSAVLTIPAPNVGIFTGTTGPAFNVVDIADAALQTYLGLFDGSGPATISDGESIIVSSAVGRRIHKKSRRG
jgi:hypothetical protein